MSPTARGQQAARAQATCANSKANAKVENAQLSISIVAGVALEKLRAQRRSRVYRRRQVRRLEASGHFARCVCVCNSQLITEGRPARNSTSGPAQVMPDCRLAEAQARPARFGRPLKSAPTRRRRRRNSSSRGNSRPHSVGSCAGLTNHAAKPNWSGRARHKEMLLLPLLLNCRQRIRPI